MESDQFCPNYVHIFKVPNPSFSLLGGDTGLAAQLAYLLTNANCPTIMYCCLLILCGVFVHLSLISDKMSV